MKVMHLYSTQPNNQYADLLLTLSMFTGAGGVDETKAAAVLRQGKGIVIQMTPFTAISIKS